MDCLRCNTCGTILDSDSNLLLLGDGSLICNNCYRCSVCNKKIEDLAILTRDQAFCEKCFKCRNCKRKIENLIYSRTSLGTFCIECHEDFMRRRRIKALTKRLNTKELPALPSEPRDETPEAGFPASDSLTSMNFFRSVILRGSPEGGSRYSGKHQK